MQRAPADVHAEHCRRHELAYQVDIAAHPPRPVFPPRVGPLAWRVSAGAGAVYATTVVRPREGDAPYNVALIELDEGFRMMSRVEGVAPQDVRVGMRVTVAWRDGDPPVPVFVPAGERRAVRP